VTGRPFRVFIDPGHGGADPGAVSKDSKTLESRLTLELAQKLAKHLKNAGFDVTISRSDNALTQVLEERPLKAYRWKADIFISIHFNANPSSTASGFETYILPAHGMLSTTTANPSPAARAQANTLQNGNANDYLNMQLGFAIQRRMLKSTKLEDRGLRRARFTVLREAKMPAVLIECGFLSSPKDLKFIRTAEGQEKIVRGIYEGICDYAFGTLAPGSPAYPIKSAIIKTATDSSVVLPQPGPTQTLTKVPARLVTDDVIDITKPVWKPLPLVDDPNEDPRLKKIRLEAAKAAGL
jgi:N-acetylmuramoyl-L-alanine amidase